MSLKLQFVYKENLFVRDFNGIRLSQKQPYFQDRKKINNLIKSHPK